MNIDLKQIQALLRLLEKRDVAEFEFEDEHVRLRLVRGVAASASQQNNARIVASSVDTPSVAPPADTSESYEFVTSPFVGTYYGSPSPGNPPFVTVGKTISPGQTLCIIEAMKLMNEIEAEQAGVICEVLVEEGRPVEFGQKLFSYRKS